MYKVGIYGGAFNPPHKGHVHLAQNAVAELKLKELVIIPTAVPPHKEQANTDFSDRFAMCELAFKNIPQAKICDVEKNIRGKSYTINTLRELRKKYDSDTEFYLLIGSDMLFGFTEWYKYESILKESKVVAVARDVNDYADMIEEATSIGRIKVLTTIATPMSSTDIRARLAEGADVDDVYLCDEVAKYIAEKKLYC